MRPRLSSFTRWAVVLGLGWGWVSQSFAQVKAPAAPESYAATIRYRIRADRDGRILQFREMEKNLAAAGFKPTDPNAAKLAQFDPASETLTGTVPSVSAAKMLDDPRVQTVLLSPAGYTLPEDGAAPVQIRLTLSAGLFPTEQRLLHEQAVARLDRLGFRENVGYDNVGYTRVRGAIPARVVPTLVKDLRNLPAGWFAADVPRDEADLPFRSVLPVRVVEVLAGAPDTAAALQPAPPPGKITADARALMAVPGQPIRLEYILSAPLEASSKDLRDNILFVSKTALIEGIAGNVVWIRAYSPADVEAIAALPEFRHVRAPRVTAESAEFYSGTVPPVSDWLRKSNVTLLHEKGYRGAGTKIVVLGSEFPNVESFIGKQLPKSTTFLDMTEEVNDAAVASPVTAGRGAGLVAAIAAASTAPDATFVLIRLDPAAFHQVLSVARAATGIKDLTEGLRSKAERFTRLNATFVDRRQSVMAEYTSATADLSDNPKSVQRRAAALAEVKKLDADQAAFQAAFERLKVLVKGFDDLANASVIINTLVWDAGHAAEGLNPLQDLLETRFVPPVVSSALHPGPTARPPVWVQAASGSVGAVWAGPARDLDSNGIMEFVPAGSKLPQGTWTPEINFLSARTADGKTTDVLPAGAKLRFSLQWREPVDPEISLLEPNIQFRIRLLRQVDPTGTKAGTDEFVEVARSAAEPVRLYKAPTSGVYMLSLDATLPEEGRYAVQVDYSVPALRTIRARQIRAEIYPRLVVEAGDAATLAKGRIQFATFAPTDPGVGVPGDSHVAITVATEEPGHSVLGAGPGLGLRTKPDVLARGVIDINGRAIAGPAVAAGYVGGLAACVRGTGATAGLVLRDFGAPGAPVVVPKAWLDTLPKK